MLSRYRGDALSLHVNEVRQFFPGRKLAHMTCPTCGRRCQMLFLHPDNLEEWKCKVCQRFIVGHNGRNAVYALARARNALTRLTREHQRQVVPQEATPAPPTRTRPEAPED
jgi:methionyl-tRNA synthetase